MSAGADHVREGPCRVAGAALAAGLVPSVPGRLGQHADRCGCLRDVRAGQLRPAAQQPRLPVLPQRHLRLLLGLHPLCHVHYRHLRTPPCAPSPPSPPPPPKKHYAAFYILYILRVEGCFEKMWGGYTCSTFSSQVCGKGGAFVRRSGWRIACGHTPTSGQRRRRTRRRRSMALSGWEALLSSLLRHFRGTIDSVCAERDSGPWGRRDA